MDGEFLKQKTTHRGGENSKLQGLQGQRVWNISEQIQGTTGHHGAKAKGCERLCGCVVLHSMLKTHQGRADRAPENDVAALRNEQVVYVPESFD